MQILFWLTLGGGFVWWIIDIIRIKNLVKNANTEIQNKILLDLKSINVFEKPEIVRNKSAVRVRLA